MKAFFTSPIKLRLALTVLICAGVFKISAHHIMDVAVRYGNAPQDAWIYPLCIDGMILLSALYLAARSGVSKATKFWGLVARYFGFAATIFCNVCHAGNLNPVACIINVFPALALIVVMEMLICGSKAMIATGKRQARTTKK